MLHFKKRLAISVLTCSLVCLIGLATDTEDMAADAVALGFVRARRAAHLSVLERMGRNTFREQVCKQDMRLPSGVIDSVLYRTSDPAQLPETAQRLASSPDTYKVTARFGVGVCLLGGGSPAQSNYSVFIATYESRWTSFWRIFWE